MLLITITGYTLSTFFVDIILLVLNRIPQDPYENLIEKLYYFGIEAQVYTSAFIRSCNWILVIERITSTLKRKNYERYHNYGVAIGICFVIISYGIIVKNIYRIWEDFDKNYYTFSIAFDFVTILISGYLWYKNIKLRRLTILSTRDLSEKFQLNENIRLVKFTFPFIVPYILINTTFNFIIDYGKSLTSDIDLILAYNDFFIFTSYIIIFSFILQKRNFFKCFIHRNINGTIILCSTIKIHKKSKIMVGKKNEIKKSEVQNNLQTLKINGKNIPVNYNDEAYYNVVTKAW